MENAPVNFFAVPYSAKTYSSYKENDFKQVMFYVNKKGAPKDSFL